MTVEKFPYYEEEPCFGQMETNAQAIGGVIREELAKRAEQSIRNQIVEIIQSNDDEMFVGDLLDLVAKSNGYDSVAPTWYVLEKMQSEGLVAMYVSDGDRYTVSLTRSSQQK